MKSVLEQFEIQSAELDSYLIFLKKLEHNSTVLVNAESKREVRGFGDDSFKVMKASFFLQLYNIIECFTREAFGQLYETLHNEQLVYEDVSNKIKQVWLDQNLAKLTIKTASPENYHKKCREVVTDIFDKKKLMLSSRDLPLLGNIDANQIRSICKIHGIEFKPHYRSRGGGVLETIKEKRNHLSHGNTTFTECGREYTVGDLERHKRESVIYIRGLLKHIEKYISNKEYTAEI